MFHTHLVIPFIHLFIHPFHIIAAQFILNLIIINIPPPSSASVSPSPSWWSLLVSVSVSAISITIFQSHLCLKFRRWWWWLLKWMSEWKGQKKKGIKLKLKGKKRHILNLIIKCIYSHSKLFIVKRQKAFKLNLLKLECNGYDSGKRAYTYMWWCCWCWCWRVVYMYSKQRWS